MRASPPPPTGTPDGLADGGAALWRGTIATRELDSQQLVLLLEACRVKDRLDRLHSMRDGSPWRVLTAPDGSLLDVRLDAQRRVVATTDLLRKLLASIRPRERAPATSPARATR